MAGVYEMRFEGGVWHRSRTRPDFSPLDFSQRFTGTFSEDGNTITGQWKISRDHSTWERDFGLTYSRTPPSGGS